MGKVEITLRVSAVRRIKKHNDWAHGHIIIRNFCRQLSAEVKDLVIIMQMPGKALGAFLDRKMIIALRLRFG